MVGKDWSVFARPLKAESLNVCAFSVKFGAGLKNSEDDLFWSGTGWIGTAGRAVVVPVAVQYHWHLLRNLVQFTIRLQGSPEGTTVLDGLSV